MRSLERTIGLLTVGSDDLIHVDAASFERRYSSGSEESIGGTPHRQQSDDIAFACVRGGIPRCITLVVDK